MITLIFAAAVGIATAFIGFFLDVPWYADLIAMAVMFAAWTRKDWTK